jgi:Tripartite tricarboxylate transporter family receptor
VSGFAWAQTYPSRPITMIVPFAPGGLTDVIGRVLADGMRTSLGRSVIIENVGGENGSIGTRRVARAAPDGYALVVGSSRCSAVRRRRGRTRRTMPAIGFVHTQATGIPSAALDLVCAAQVRQTHQAAYFSARDDQATRLLVGVANESQNAASAPIRFSSDRGYMFS